MRSPSRLALLRLVALVGLLASVLLTAETLRPGRKFCPLEQACEAARSSALGSVLGVPTSIVGILAFASLLALTFSPRALGRGFLRGAGTLAGLLGIGLVLYQAIALEGFCPLCLIADASGVAAGAVVWVGGPIAAAAGSRRRWIPWTAVAALLVAAPMAWPASGPPAWSSLEGRGPTSEVSPGHIPIVEYLNPFCAHCRATHVRLARVLEEEGTPVARVRLYVWAGRSPPLWSKACVCAQDQSGGQDLERPFFRELMKARNEEPTEIWAAAKRAGLDVSALEECVARGGADERLRWIRARTDAAGLLGLPTLDIGARRLEGEQTEEDLRAAIAAAAVTLSRPAR